MAFGAAPGKMMGVAKACGFGAGLQLKIGVRRIIWLDRQHSKDNLVRAAQEGYIRVIKWPTFSDHIKWCASLACQEIIPFNRCAPGMHNVMNEAALWEERFKILPNYELAGNE
ncbi:hypothetical protein HDV00_005256 [Rhizophlyctis rosea]|nr:hypothetical protein HDV00_005256 [Rhizophlyctis rosea]